jgi:hypothetical protein
LQLIQLGLGAGAIEYRLRLGRLHRIQRGVYAVGHRAISREGRWMAAVLACGPGAVLSHRSAAALWGLRPNHAGPIEVTVPGARPNGRPFVARSSNLQPGEFTVERGIPVTTPAMTLLDLGSVLAPHELERALRETEVLRLTDIGELEALLARHPRRRGTRALRQAVNEAVQTAGITRSELEDRFKGILLQAKLPRPEHNATLELDAATSIEVDCLWRETRLIVELDGHAFHATRASYERDRIRDRRLMTAGWRVIRMTWRQVRDEHDAVVADLRSLLG